jgi:hypothetical protein
MILGSSYSIFQKPPHLTVVNDAWIVGWLFFLCLSFLMDENWIMVIGGCMLLELGYPFGRRSCLSE